MSDKTTFTLTSNEEIEPQPVLGHSHRSLRSCVEHAMADYFHHLDGQDCTNLYQMVLKEVEAPLLEAVMNYTRNNQCKAAEMLNINRGTLRK
ncbi:MAG TPA: DNA-binding transcriptional regulator Fis, partial [Porticoccaceae bacterium]|nr:DNA-binding transcriptional regulator Fis [Porticoccaceae bacterium]